MNLFLVQSPLQVLSACEARERFGGPFLLVVARKRHKESTARQLDLAIAETGWGSAVLYLDSDAGRGLANLWRKLAVFWRLFRLGRQGVDRLCIGDFRSIWMNRARGIVRPRATWLLDDGAVTVAMQAQYLSQGIYWPPHHKGRFKGWLRGFFSRLLGSGAVMGTPVHLFTSFRVSPVAGPGQQLLHNDYAWLRRHAHEKAVERDCAYFFGSKLSESGVVPLAQECECLWRIFRAYRDAGTRMVYIRHRGDGAAKLAFLRERGVPVRSLDMPAELYFAQARSIPPEIASFYSSALQTVSVMTDFERVVAFRLPADMMVPRLRDPVASVYDSYRDGGILVREIPPA